MAGELEARQRYQMVEKVERYVHSSRQRHVVTDRQTEQVQQYHAPHASSARADAR